MPFSKGLPKTIYTSGIIDLSYVFNTKNNLASRYDAISGYKDSLSYDAMNRLTNWNIYKNGTNQQSNSLLYDSATGNMNSKSGLANMQYGENSKPPHALTSFTTSLTNFNNSQTIRYTDFKKVKYISEWGDILNIYYGVDEQRIKSDWVRSTGGTQVKYYMGNYEEENNSGVIRKIHYICGGNGLAAVYVQNGNNDTLYYAHTDYLGSLTALSLPNGTVVERYAYDPWGNRRNPNNWTQADTRTKFILDRGYTMHEHLTAFKLINMNGRVYDPVTAQFLSPDPRISYPGNWLNYNRYQYGLNNPFKYTDPTGEFPWIPLLFYAFQSGIMQGAMSQINGDSFWSGFAQGAAISVGSSLLTFGVGQVFGHALGGIGTELARAGAHSLIGGGVSALQGGNFWQGAAISGLSSLAGSGMQAMGWGGDYLPLVTGAVGAGTAWAVGGDPLSGFMQGYGVGALNHKGEKFVADDGTIGEYSCDDAVIWGTRPAPRVVYPVVGDGLDILVELALTKGIFSFFKIATAGRAAKGGVQYTKSNLKLGQEMHKSYHAGEAGKEFRLPSGKRIDFLDTNNKIIYEYKPYNPRSIQLGTKQLNNYLHELQTMPRYQGEWQTVLEFY